MDSSNASITRKYAATIFAVILVIGMIGSVGVVSANTTDTTNASTNTDSLDDIGVMWSSNATHVNVIMKPDGTLSGPVEVSVLFITDSGDVLATDHSVARIPESSAVSSNETVKIYSIPRDHFPDARVDSMVKIRTTNTSTVETITLTNTDGDSIHGSAGSSSESVSDRSVSLATISPDYSIPSDSFRVYYSEDVDQDVSDSETGNTTPDYDVDASDLGKMLERSEGTIPPGEWAQYNDLAFDSASSAPALIDMSWVEYQLNQLTSIEQRGYHSIVLNGYEDELEDDGVIKDSYIGVTGTLPGVTPKYESVSYMVPRSGGVMTYFDYRLDDEVLPDDTTDDVVTHTDGSETPSWASDKYKQTQERTTYQIENTTTQTVVQQKTITGDWVDLSVTEDMSGGLAADYTVLNQSEAQFRVNGTVQSNNTKYRWNRNRTRQFNVRENVDVSGSETLTVSGSTTASETVTGNGTECTTTSDDVTVDTTKTYTVTKVWNWETRVVRTYTFTENVDETFSVSGTVCGDVGENETSTTATGTISGSTTVTANYDTDKTVRYEWWPSWNDWYIDETWLHSYNEVNVDDRFNGTVVTNNDDNMEVETVSVEVAPDRYHSFVQVNYDDYELDRINPISRFEYSGGETYLSTDWKVYSKTVNGTAKEFTHDDQETVTIPNQMGLYMFNEGDGLELTSYETVRKPENSSLSDGDMMQRVELAGFVRENISATRQPMGENVKLNASDPAVYTKYSLLNAPSPLTNVENVMGKNVDIEREKVIPYVRPDVHIGYNSGSGEMVVTVSHDGQPVRGQEIFVTTTTETYGTYTTNDQGQATINADTNMGMTHVDVEVKPDSWEDHIDPESGQIYDDSSPEGSIFVGHVVAEKTVGSPQVVSYMKGIVVSSMMAIPLILLYLLWRDAELGI